jgi:hypothetical protein
VYVKSCGAPPVAIFVSSDTTFCDEGGTCIDFTDISTGSPTSWLWKFPGAQPDTSTAQNPSNICYYVPGSYAVTLIVTNQYGTDTLDVLPHIIFGSGAAQPVLTLKDDTIFSSPAVSYQWYFNGSPIPGATNSYYIPTLNGNYSVYITDNIGCSRLSNSISFSVGIDELNYFAQQVKVYPNPAGDQFTVYGLQFTEDAGLQLFNILGEDVYGWKPETVNDKPETVNGKPETVMDVSSLSNGIYLLKISFGSVVINKKVVIAR